MLLDRDIHIFYKRQVLGIEPGEIFFQNIENSCWKGNIVSTIVITERKEFCNCHLQVLRDGNIFQKWTHILTFLKAN